MIKADIRKLSKGASTALSVWGKTDDILYEYTVFIRTFKRVFMGKIDAESYNKVESVLGALTIEAFMSERGERDDTSSDSDSDNTD